MAARIDVIIPTYNNLESLQRCLKGFYHQSFQNFRLIVCIDGSTDGTGEWLKSQTFPFSVIIKTHADGQNHGRNATRNLALAEISSPYLVFLDSDMWIDSHFLSYHLEFAADKKTVSVGKVSYKNRSTNLWGAYLETRGAGKFAHGDTLPYTHFVTGNSCLPSSVFLKLQGQDSNMKTYGGGDTEFAIRMAKEHPIRLRYNERAVAHSEMDKTLAYAMNQMEEFGRINLPYILKKHPEHKELFRMDEILADNAHGKRLRMLLRIPVPHFPETILRWWPEFLRNKGIAWMVAKAMFRGYKKSNPSL